MIHDLFHATFICRSKTDPKVILATLQQFPPGGGIGRMSHVILIDMIDHIRDLETYLKHCRDAINDIDEDLELFNDMKDTEHTLLEVTNILFSTCTNIHRTLLMCSSDKSSILSQ